MPTVKDDNTGEEVEVVQVEAVVTVASINSLASEFPPSASKMIEQAMVWAVQECNSKGVTDATEVREAILKAREEMKSSLRMQMADQRSQQR